MRTHRKRDSGPKCLKKESGRSVVSAVSLPVLGPHFTRCSRPMSSDALNRAAAPLNLWYEFVGMHDTHNRPCKYSSTSSLHHSLTELGSAHCELQSKPLQGRTALTGHALVTSVAYHSCLYERIACDAACTKGTQNAYPLEPSTLLVSSHFDIEFGVRVTNKKQI